MLPGPEFGVKGISRTTRVAFSLASLTVAAGVLLSVFAGDWNWLARSGALVVVIGIVLTSTQVLESAQRLRHRRNQWENRLRHTSQRDAANTNPSMHDWASDMRALSRARQREEDTWEYERSGVYMLVVGTLLWGFGDLLGVFLGWL